MILNSFRKYYLFMILIINILIGNQIQDKNNFSSSFIIPSETGIKMSVNVWGQVRQPGQYLIPYSISMDIIKLLSLAGGPNEGANLKNIKIIRELDNNQNKIIKINLNKYISSGDKSLLPKIEPNDTIIIDATFWYDLKGSSTYVQTLLTMLVLLNQLGNNN